MDRPDDMGADWTTEPSCSDALSKLLPGAVVPGFQNLRAVDMKGRGGGKQLQTSSTHCVIHLLSESRSIELFHL